MRKASEALIDLQEDNENIGGIWLFFREEGWVFWGTVLWDLVIIVSTEETNYFLLISGRYNNVTY
jgi:hypothetical protein